jgi:hypothetical protein
VVLESTPPPPTDMTVTRLGVAEMWYLSTDEHWRKDIHLRMSRTDYQKLGMLAIIQLQRRMKRYFRIQTGEGGDTATATPSDATEQPQDSNHKEDNCSLLTLLRYNNRSEKKGGLYCAHRR